jgi:hypothetical protein
LQLNLSSTSTRRYSRDRSKQPAGIVASGKKAAGVVAANKDGTSPSTTSSASAGKPKTPTAPVSAGDYYTVSTAGVSSLFDWTGTASPGGFEKVFFFLK